ncbi:MAG: hypothetical protein AAF368_05240 [Planctomycetota bacterium]
MSWKLPSIVLVLVLGAALAQPLQETPAVTSAVRKTAAKERILVQEVRLNAPVEEAWAAYTTETGWSAWSSPVVAIDLRVAGTIRTNYDVSAKIEDPGTNTLRILNYVPNEVLTLKAEVEGELQGVIAEDIDKMSNVILFDAVSAEECRIRSFGIGYRDIPEYDGILDYFTTANEELLMHMKRYVEDGVRRSWEKKQ